MAYSLFFLSGIALFCLLFTFLLYKTFDIYNKRRRYRHIPGPPTFGISGFYLGNFLERRIAEKNGIIFMDLVNEW